MLLQVLRRCAMKSEMHNTRHGDSSSEEEKALRKALDLDEKRLGPQHPVVAESLNRLAVLLYNSNRPEEAEPLLRRVVEIFVKNLGPDNSATVTVINSYISSLQTAGIDFNGILVKLRGIAPGVEQAMAQTAATNANAHARSLEQKGDWPGAEREYQRALELSPNNMIILGNYAFLLQNFRRDYAGARVLYQRALQADSTDAINHANFAGLCLVMGMSTEAQEHLREAWRLVASKADRYTCRTLFLRAALAALQNEDVTLYLGKLKTLFDLGIQPMPSRNTSVREYLQNNLSADLFALFDAIYTAINEPTGIAKLGALPAWQEVPAIPLETPWQ